MSQQPIYDRQQARKRAELLGPDASLKDQIRAQVRQELRDRIAALDPKSPLLVILDEESLKKE